MLGDIICSLARKGGGGIGFRLFFFFNCPTLSERRRLHLTYLLIRPRLATTYLKRNILPLTHPIYLFSCPLISLLRRWNKKNQPIRANDRPMNLHLHISRISRHCFCRLLSHPHIQSSSYWQGSLAKNHRHYVQVQSNAYWIS